MVNTTLCYIEKDGKYLMLHRVKKQKDLNKDKWIAIGGKFEETESPEDCCIREVKEETNLTLNSIVYKGIVTFVMEDGFTEFMHLFYTDDFSGKQFTSEECNEGNLEWVAKDKINELPHWKGDEIFLSLIQKNVPFFSLKLIYDHGILVKAVLNNKNLDLNQLSL